LLTLCNDNLDRLTQVTSFRTTGRLDTVTYPNDQTTHYSYFDDEHDFRLQTIHHKNPSAATLSKFDYTYDAVGNILTWRQERAGATTQIYTFGHDLVDQLTSAVLNDTGTPANTLKRQAWAYDAAGNRTVDQDDDALFATSHDSMNRLQSRAPGGPIKMTGTLNEAAMVTIDGKPAAVDSSNNFQGTAQIGSGTTTVTVKAKDYSGNETTQQFEIDASGGTTSYTYDANGNLTSDGTKTYFWNALNQLVEVKEGTTTIATFDYDGAGRRTEKVAAGVTHAYIYDAEDIAEERLTGSTTDTIRYYHGAGIDQPLARKNSSDVVTYYLADHLGSIVQETSSAGGVTLDREYDLWGNLTQGNANAGYSFSGREWDNEIGIYYYRARYYDPSIGQFIADDPSGFSGGDTNLYKYVGGNPAIRIDPLGLSWGSVAWSAAKGAAMAAGGTVAVGALAVGLVAVGVPAAAVTTVLAGVTVVGAFALGYDVGAASLRGDYDRIAYDAGAVIGGAAVGASIGRFVAEGVNGVKSPPWSWRSDSEQAYDPDYVGGSPGKWWKSGPNPGSAAGSTAVGGAGAAALLRPKPTSCR